jgi:hypothetical protein
MSKSSLNDKGDAQGSVAAIEIDGRKSVRRARSNGSLRWILFIMLQQHRVDRPFEDFFMLCR